MLDAGHRLRDPEGFRAASRRGHRAGSRTVVTHLLLPEEQQVAGMPGPAQVGFVVSKAVGTAVVRNRVKRRLRELARLKLALHARPGHDYVLIGRAPSFARAFPDLERDLDSALKRLHRTAQTPADKGTS